MVCVVPKRFLAQSYTHGTVCVCIVRNLCKFQNAPHSIPYTTITGFSKEEYTLNNTLKDVC